MDPLASPNGEQENNSNNNNSNNNAEGNGRRNSGENGRRISQLLDRVNGRRPSQENRNADTPASSELNAEDGRRASSANVDHVSEGGRRSSVDSGSRRPSQAQDVENRRRSSTDTGSRRISQAQNVGETRRSSAIENPPQEVRRNSAASALQDTNGSSERRNSVASSPQEGNEDRRGSAASIRNEEATENRRASAVSLPQDAGGNGRRNSTNATPSPTQEVNASGRRASGMAQEGEATADGGSRSPEGEEIARRSSRDNVSSEEISTVPATQEAGRRSILDTGKRPSVQEILRNGNGRRPSQTDDLSQAAALVSDLINRVSLSDPSTSQAPTSAAEEAKRAERRESLRRASILAGTKAPASPGEYSGRASRRGSAIARDLPRDSSEDVDSNVDDIEAEYIKDIMKKRRSTKESQLREAMQQGMFGGANAPEFHARLLALRLAVQDYELPMQLAYDELDELAANAERVRSAIEKNMTLLTIQMRRSSLRYMRSAFTALSLHTQKKNARRFAMKNANEYYQRRMLGRAFQAWRVFFLRMQKFKRLQQSAERFLRRHNLARIWRAWTSLVKRRLREDERHRREKQLVRELQIKQRECVGRRAVNAIRRRRLQRVFFAFKVGVEISREINARRDHIFYILIRRKAALAFKVWQRYATKIARDMRAIQRREKRLLMRSFWFWEDETAFSKYRKRRMRRRRLSNAFRTWLFYLAQKARYDTIILRVTRARLRRHFHDFREGCLEQKWRKRTCKRVQKKCDFIRMSWSFQAWVNYMQYQAHKRMIRTEEYVAILEKENHRTRTECDRLGRIVDTGEWDQQRVMELEQASQVLSGERDALTKLVGRLEREHALALEHQNQQEQEIKHLKDQILGSNFVSRNKLLVRGASSFNSVVRAVKSEVLKRGVNTDVVYSIDKMSMDQVSVFPDGDLRVKPLNKFDKGKWMHRASTDSTKAFMGDPKVPLIQ